MRARGILTILRRNKAITIYASVGLLIILALGFGAHTWQSRHRLETRPDVGAIITSQHLLKTVQELQASLSNDTQRDNGKIVRQYVNLLDQIEQDCNDMQYYGRLATEKSAPEELTTYLQKSAKLCAELNSFAIESKQIYIATTPLLETNANAKRYKTLPFINSYTRNQGLHAITITAERLAAATHKLTFATQTIETVSELEKTARQSTALNFYPAMRVAQQKILNERKVYWSNYGELSSLIETLHSQRNTYCGLVPSLRATSAICKH